MKTVESAIPDKMNKVFRIPLGVIASISPFNFPLYLSMRTIVPALALGNTIVHKADLQTVILAALLLQKHLKKLAFQEVYSNSY
ncbi:acyl-CoA reductase-like NAD-dependent aldehyde dehydrogenase [Cytobacillus purgationiresistens]|uniref:Acyl-CoA reductase-like NAD-dependent aldehyde dehydrogenase n=1 Tax=Cytobacillus purgationiresistens TaxID=863449 RepID=A0ABU0ALL2_9BACI|nr:acyl-CoA reductase-like NAD-dependent aldehyde dehydrogenase [Cytobacillus purgationiresistens]